MAERQSEIAGAALWLPPGEFPLSLARRLRALPRMLSIAAVRPGAVRSLARLGAAIEEVFPPDPVWYLEVLGVARDAQGRGLGTALLAPGLERADREGVPCYLETSKPANVSFYQRLGFVVEREGVEFVRGAPTFWLMRRAPGG